MKNNFLSTKQCTPKSEITDMAKNKCIMNVTDGSVNQLTMLQLALMDKAFVTLFEDLLICIKLSPYSI